MYSREEYDSKSMAQWLQLYELQKKAGLKKGKKAPERNKILETRVAMIEVIIERSSNESLFADQMLKASNRNNTALDRNGSRER